MLTTNVIGYRERVIGLVTPVKLKCALKNNYHNTVDCANCD